MQAQQAGVGTIQRIAKAVFIGTFISLAAAPAGASGRAVQYICPASEHLSVERDGSIAHVTLADRSYDMRRKHSSIGAKYLSRDAALIIDGPSAIFVAPDHLNLGTCITAVPVASSQ